MTVIELNDSEWITGPESKVLKVIQTDAFRCEQTQFKKKQTVVPNSKMRKLAPFIDSDGLMRPKGMLKHSVLLFDQKHPTILPANEVAVQLFVEQEHKVKS